MTFNEMSKEHNLPTNRDAAYVYAKFKKWYAKRVEECGLTGNPSVFQPTFYWWDNLNARYVALPFAIEPGDLVMFNGKYAVVEGLSESSCTYSNQTMFNEETGKFETMQFMEFPCGLRIRDSNGCSCVANQRDVKFADIPQEIFKLACNKASTCPMMGGKENV